MKFEHVKVDSRMVVAFPNVEGCSSSAIRVLGFTMITDVTGKAALAFEYASFL